MSESLFVLAAHFILCIGLPESENGGGQFGVLNLKHQTAVFPLNNGI